MQKFVVIAAVVTVLLILGTIAYIYIIYTPLPDEPRLTAMPEQAMIQIGNRERNYLYYIPKSLKKNASLVIVLHGTGMDARKMRAWTAYEFDQLADQKGFVVVYPDGYKGNWNDCRSDAPFPAKKENIDDVGFMHTLVEKFKQDLKIDPGKVYVFGFSNGGQMALRLAIEESHLIAAISAVGANLPTPATCSCTLEGKTSRVLLIAGTKDPISPYRGGEVTLFGFKKIGTVISAQATAESLAKRNGINIIPLLKSLQYSKKTDTEKDTLIYPERQVWTKAGQPVVELYTIYNGGHVIPQSNFRFPRLMGKTTGNFDAPRQAIYFFNL